MQHIVAFPRKDKISKFSGVDTDPTCGEDTPSAHPIPSTASASWRLVPILCLLVPLQLAVAGKTAALK